MRSKTLDPVSQMPVERAVFASASRGKVKGYQLVAKSAGVDRDLAWTLSRWCPTQMRSEKPDDWTLNCFPLNDEYTAVTRTVLGGPEYSGRGAAEVVTVILVVDRESLRGYDWNPVWFGRNAITLGHLKLPWLLNCESLETVMFPASPILIREHETSDIKYSSVDRPLDQALELIQRGRRVAVAGLADPIQAAERLLGQLPTETRAGVSFTTGLPPAIRRPYQVHFFDQIDPPLQNTLAAHKVECVFC